MESEVSENKSLLLHIRPDPVIADTPAYSALVVYHLPIGSQTRPVSSSFNFFIEYSIYMFLKNIPTRLTTTVIIDYRCGDNQC